MNYHRLLTARSNVYISIGDTKVEEDNFYGSFADLSTSDSESVKSCLCSPKIMAHYDSWGKTAILASSHQWVDIEKVLPLMHKSMTRNFSIVEIRQQILAELQSLDTSAPFARAKRFPGDKVFVDISLGDFPRRWMQIVSALSYKAEQGERGTSKPSSSTALNSTFQDFSGSSDASTSFYNAISAMTAALAGGADLIDRETFEDSYGLFWVVQGN